jgi:hypothetical protein
MAAAINQAAPVMAKEEHKPLRESSAEKGAPIP